jgi:hypothetical protein
MLAKPALKTLEQNRGRWRESCVALLNHHDSNSEGVQSSPAELATAAWGLRIGLPLVSCEREKVTSVTSGRALYLSLVMNIEYFLTRMDEPPSVALNL